MMKPKTALKILIPAIFLTGLLFLIDSDEDIPDPDFLSRDLFFQIGNDVISVPVVAARAVSIPPNQTNPLPRYRFNSFFGGGEYRLFANKELKAAMINLATDPTMPARVSGIELWIGYYGIYGESGISQKICPLLSKTWSQLACRNEFPPALKGLPRRFHLTTEGGHRAVFIGAQTVRGRDLFKAMGPLSPQTKTACADERNYCLSALIVSDEIYAGWADTCSQVTVENCKQLNIAKGEALSEFVQNELRVD